MKKIAALLLALTMLLALTACGSKSDDKVVTVGATPAPTAKFWRSPRTSWPRTVTPWKSRNSTTM